MIHPRLLTRLCYFAMMSLAIGLNLLPVFLTELSAEHGGLSKEDLGQLGAVSFAGLVVGILATGPLADRWGAKPFAVLGSALMAVSLPASAFAQGYGSLCVSLFFLGLGAGVLDMILSPVVAALNPERRAVAMNLLHSFYCVGAVVTILAGTLVLKAGHGWKVACLSLVPMPLVLVVALLTQQFPAMATHEDGHTPVRKLMRERWFIAALAAIFLGGATELGMAQWLPAYAETSLGYPAWGAGISLLLFSVAMAAGRMIIGALPRLDPFVIMIWSCGLTVVVFLAGSFLPHPALALTACILAGFTGSCLWPTTLAVTADHYPGGGASMFGLLAALGNAGGIFMPWVVGGIADRSNLHWGLAVSAIAPAVMLPLVIWMRATKRSPA
ncbi:MAG: MFS transporter [Verrucomicrobiaceae bacterium]|nr:MAG: MFS transporter [Verrucomicrobiaceae bacterium]